MGRSEDGNRYWEEDLDYVIGIDPGASGALALFCPQKAQVLDLRDTPNNVRQLTTGKKSTRVDVGGLIKIIDMWQEKALRDNAKLHVHIEDVAAYGKQSAPAAFNFGYAAGLAYGICSAYGMDILLVHPATWKNQFGLKASEKDQARLLALEMFPYLNKLLRRKMDVDRADAVLIAAYKRTM